jgi:transposase InsO family protein
MPWKVCSLELQRQALCYQIVHQCRSVSGVCREFGVSRKTAYKWLKLYRGDPEVSLADRSRRPRSSPARTDASLEQQVLALRDRHRWGARKIWRVLQQRGVATPSPRTVTAVLARHGRIERAVAAAEDAATIRFERSQPNALWQMDHKGPIEIERRRHHPLTVLDDHSRFCLCFEPLTDLTLVSAWRVLWDLFEEYGLPEALLCDGAFAARHEAGGGVSELDQRLIRLGIRPIHGRAYHPQTQGKVERLHGTVDYELLDFYARRDDHDSFRQDRDRWLQTYNLVRPHESLGDRPPISRYRRSPRVRPATLPEIEYPAGAVLRRVSQVGDIHYRRVRIALSRSLCRQLVRVEEREKEFAVYYAWKLLRVIRHEQLIGRGHNQVT